jgi:hypothetical protein
MEKEQQTIERCCLFAVFRLTEEKNGVLLTKRKRFSKITV